MENNAALVAGLIAVVVAALMYVIAYPFLSGDAKAQKRAAALMTNTKDRGVASRTSNDPAKRRKAIADTLKEFESQSKKKKVTIEQRIAQAGLTITPTGYFIASAICGAVLAGVLFVVNGNMLVVAGGAVVGIFGLPSWVCPSFAIGASPSSSRNFQARSTSSSAAFAPVCRSSIAFASSRARRRSRCGASSGKSSNLRPSDFPSAKPRSVSPIGCRSRRRRSFRSS